MRVAVLGINYKSADLAVREVFAKACVQRFTHQGEFPSVLLATCNRTEIYFSAPNLADVHTQILSILRTEINQPFEHHVYSYFGEDCFAHLAGVTAGLDSVVLAETEIQRQVKVAYEQASLRMPLPSTLHFLFQKCLKLGKWMRTRCGSSFNQTSLESVVFHFTKIISPQGRVFFLGNSEINRKIMTYFKGKGIHDLALCTRAPLSAKEFADEKEVKLIPWDALSTWTEWDTVICGTNHSDYLIREEALKESCTTRLILDLSLPRNADPQLNRHSQITLMNIEELGQILHKKHQEHMEQVAFAQKEIRHAVEKQFALYTNKQHKTLTSLSS
jgi:glutamyl-tRNA reductase